MRKSTGQRQIKVILVMALTADGFTARFSNEYTDWSSAADKKLFLEISKKAGVVIMGKNTYNTLKSPLKNRLNIVMGKNDINQVEKNLRFFSGDPLLLLEELENQGFKEAVLCGGASTNTVFFEKDAIDEAVFTISPLMFGKGISVFNTKINCRLFLEECKKIDKNTIMLRYLFNKE
ncbi:MAG: dihydrofolate reductase [Desulforegulaceae bacterium]|nr:dihydrofolate reductase [Desulforegulaceae bacterium]